MKLFIYFFHFVCARKKRHTIVRLFRLFVEILNCTTLSFTELWQARRFSEFWTNWSILDFFFFCPRHTTVRHFFRFSWQTWSSRCNSCLQQSHKWLLLPWVMSCSHQRKNSRVCLIKDYNSRVITFTEHKQEVHNLCNFPIDTIVWFQNISHPLNSKHETHQTCQTGPNWWTQKQPPRSMWLSCSVGKVNQLFISSGSLTRLTVMPDKAYWGVLQRGWQRHQGQGWAGVGRPQQAQYLEHSLQLQSKKFK